MYGNYRVTLGLVREKLSEFQVDSNYYLPKIGIYLGYIHDFVKKKNIILSLTAIEFLLRITALTFPTQSQVSFENTV